MLFASYRPSCHREKKEQPGGRNEIHTATVQWQKTWLQECGHSSEVDELRCVTRLNWKLTVWLKEYTKQKNDVTQNRIQVSREFPKSVGVQSTVGMGLQGGLPPRNNTKTVKNENVGVIYL